MTNDYASDIASNCEPYKVGIMPTEDGDKVVLVFRANQDDQTLFWLDASGAQELAKALIETACQILEAGTDIPPTKN